MGNSLPALNDVTAHELPEIVAEAAKVYYSCRPDFPERKNHLPHSLSHSLFGAQNCDILRRAAEAGGLLLDAMITSMDASKDKPASVPLMVMENGCGSPCIDLRQVSSELADLAKDADLVHPHRVSASYFLYYYLFFLLFAPGYSRRHGQSSPHQLQSALQVRRSQGEYPFFWIKAITNYFFKTFLARFLQLAMVKNQRLAEKLVGGNIYDCICRFESV